MLGHDQTFVLIGSHGMLAHGIAQDLGVIPDIRIGQIIVAVVFKGKRTFRLTVGQVFQTVDTTHLELMIAPLHHFRRGVVSQFLHVVLQFRTASGTPEDIGIAVGSQQHTGVDTIDTLNRLRLRDKRSFRTVGNSHSDAKSPTRFGGCGEIEIVLPISLHAVGCPHGIGVWPDPGYLVLGDDDSMIGPVGQIFRREHMVVLHAEPVLSLSLRWKDVVRRIEVHLIIKYACGRVSGELVTNDRILS